MSLQFLRNTYHLKTAVLMSSVMSAGFHSLQHPDFASWNRDRRWKGWRHVAILRGPHRDPGLRHLGRCVISSIRVLLSSTENLKPSVPFQKACCLVSQSCLTLCNPMACSTPGFPVHHQLPEFAQTHVHWVDDPTQHLILCHPILLLPSIFPSIGSFPVNWFFTSGGQSNGVSASASVLPNEYSGLISFRMDWLDLLVVQGLSRVFSNTTVQKHQFFSALLSL